MGAGQPLRALYSLLRHFEWSEAPLFSGVRTGASRPAPSPGYYETVSAPIVAALVGRRA